MFKQARIKLTIYYLLIMMLVSGFFSLVLYLGFNQQLDQSFRRAEMRYQAEQMGLKPPRRMGDNWAEMHPELKNLPNSPFAIEDLQIAKKAMAWRLLQLNSLILFFSALTSYILAGITLKPIEEAMEEQKRFIADASHELRTPLTALKTNIEVNLRSKKLTLKDSKKALQENLQDVNSLQKLSNNLLSLINNNSQKFEQMDVKEIISKVVGQLKPLADKKNIALLDKSKSIKFKAIENKIEELLIILIDNAIKYTPKKGKIYILTKSDNKNLIIKIKDNGVGIEAEDLKHIFDRFYRADKSRTKNNADGFGLGLSIAQKIVQKHRGKIEVESKVSKGTVFTLHFPL